MTTGVFLGVNTTRFLTNSYPDLMPSNRDANIYSMAQQISKHYVDDVSSEELVQAAVQGMLDKLDDNSSILTKSHLRNLEKETLGHFDGIGLKIGWIGNQLHVIEVISDTPADRAGIQTGDQLVIIDDESVNSLNADAVSEKLYGRRDSPVRIQLLRKGVPEPIDLVLIREEIELNSVSSSRIESNFAYLRISHFQKNTKKEVQKTITSLRDENNLLGLILDIRNNPGGMLSEAIAVADLFLTEGLITFTKSQLPSREKEFFATGGDIIDGIPIVILIDGNSASAAEIVAGALSENERALLVGTKTFGKGSVQSILHLQEDISIKLTTAHYFTPNGESIQNKGLQPDILLSEISDSVLIHEAVRLLESLAAEGTYSRPIRR